MHPAVKTLASASSPAFTPTPPIPFILPPPTYLPSQRLLLFHPLPWRAQATETNEEATWFNTPLLPSSVPWPSRYRYTLSMATARAAAMPPANVSSFSASQRQRRAEGHLHDSTSRVFQQHIGEDVLAVVAMSAGTSAGLPLAPHPLP